MSTDERIEARIESEFQLIPKQKPSSDGTNTHEIQISSEGLTVNEVLEHTWVKDAYPAPDDEFTVHVKAESDIYVGSTG